jgi:hypothetical protein
VACALAIATACGDSSGDGGVDGDDGTGAPTTDSSVTDPTTGPSSADDSTGTTGGEDTGTGTEGTDGPIDGSTTDAEPCPDSHVCLAAVPEGWNGPVVRLERPALAPEPSCPTAYPTVELDAGADVVADPATCTCSCGDATGVECQVSTFLHFYGDADTCSDVVPANFEVFVTVCNILPTEFDNFTYWTLDPVLVTGGTCEPMLEQQVDPPSFANALTACGGAELLSGCDADRICAPRLGDELCIWHDGDERCPDGYDDRHVYYGGIDDQRACDECECGEPSGLCNDAYGVLYEAICNVPVSGVILADGECHPTGSAGTRSAALVLGEPTAFCEPSTSTPQGEAVGAMPTTLCCAE